MAAAGFFEVLRGDNYERWSVLMKNYLRGEGLWDVIISDADDDHRNEDWERRNAKALYAIQLSCGPHYFKLISEISDAREAWSRLSKLLGPDSKANWLNPTDLGIGNNMLHRSVKRGDWNAAKSIIMRESNAVFECNSSGKTVLHIAAIAGHEHIVEKLVNTQEQDHQLLTMQDKDGYTALALVARLNGNTKMAKCMVEKNPDLLNLKTNDDQIPLLLASATGHKEMTRYLYSKTPLSVLTDNNCLYAVVLLTQCITAEIFDVALDLLSRLPEMPLVINDFHYEGYYLPPPLLALANMPSAFPSGCGLNWWQRIIYEIITPQYQDPYGGISIKIISPAEQDKGEGRNILAGRCFLQILAYLGRRLHRVQKVQNSLLKLSVIRELYDKKLGHLLILQIMNCLRNRVSCLNKSELGEVSAHEAMLQAAKYGIIEFIKPMSDANPNLLWTTDRNQRGVFLHAILNRQRTLFEFLLKEAEEQIRMTASRQDQFGNNVLHVAVAFGPSSVIDSKVRAALEMRKEILWFKEVEKIANPTCKQATNGDGKKPHEVFTENHKALVVAGEMGAKETANFLTVVSTLVIAITFAAAFTVPGGNNQDTGFPIFLNRTLFEYFIIADAISLVASSSSVLISIGILTSRFAERDFLVVVPFKLLANLFFLFLSVVAMIVAYCVGIAMMLRGHRSTVISAISLAIVPIVALALTQLNLFFEIVKFTFYI